MMKKLLILLSALTISFFSQSQWTIMPDGPYQNDVLSTVQFEEMNNNDLVLLYKTTDDSLKMNKFVGGTWVDVVPGVLDGSVNNFNMIHNPLSDTLFIGYTKSDGFYFRIYSSAGWSPEMHYAGYTNVVQVALDEINNIPYFLVGSTNGESELISYSPTGDSLIIQSGPNDVHSNQDVSKILFNPADGYIYINYTSINDELFIRRYNNVVWGIVDDQISPHSSPFMWGSYLRYNDQTDSLEHRFIYHINNGNRYCGYNTYSYSNNGKTEVVGITPIENLDFSGNSVILDNGVVIWDSEPNLLLCGNEFYSAPNDFPSTIYVRKGLFVDSHGSLILVDMIDRDIYKREPFVLGEFEHELQSFPTVYPNPTKNSLQLEVTEEHELSIYNLSGEVVVAPQPYLPNQELDIQFLPSGLYILKLKNQSGVIHHQRFVVE